MQYDKTKTSKLTIRSDFPTSVSSALRGANLDALGFNVRFIAERRPELAVELIRIFEDASRLSEASPLAPENEHRAAITNLLHVVSTR